VDQKRTLCRIAIGLFFVGCASSDPPMDSRTGSALPASAAGTSTEKGPGVPADFAGEIRDSIPLTDYDRRAIAASDELARARNPTSRPRVQLGSGAIPPKPATAAPTVAPGGRR